MNQWSEVNDILDLRSVEQSQQLLVGDSQLYLNSLNSLTGLTTSQRGDLTEEQLIVQYLGVAGGSKSSFSLSSSKCLLFFQFQVYP